ncbi:hypothetical protein SAMN05444397_10957 [Flavobacterium aquidurense]|uniref:Uncharacterized protein n=1 Tax=Flavobacterium frigidimaris TaxID=262320 RepID=A0ABX4BQ97_FLAFR|nr:hypothetical protein [Flavobacterium frigidimaris]OXA78563.1 hypothetical protein B0A65_12560 [Flavobacterium frigidimaris]SDZ57015.1 hypothetical protein SAMN05444397_10957 [Flavobacterium aquidurense]
MRKITLLILIGFMINACSSDDNKNNSSEYREYITKKSNITAINFMPEEIFPGTDVSKPSVLKLKLITEEEFPCINYSISTTQFTKGNELVVRFDKITEPGGCFTAIGPAISYIDLPENTDKITFINGDKIDQYSININAQKISITPIEKHFTTSLYNKTFRIPTNSFAYLCGTNKNNTQIYTDFYALIKQNPDFSEFTFEGEGRIPYPITTTGNWVNHPTRFFKYKDAQEFNKLATLLNNYSTKNIEKNSGVSLSIYSWNNIKFRSWMEN